MSRFSATDLPLEGLRRIDRTFTADARGEFSRLFCAEDLAQFGWKEPIAQVNHSITSGRGTIRGLHYQIPPSAEMKLVFCIRGRVWDLALDLRRDSKTFMVAHGQELSGPARSGMLIPKGFAHGFQVLEESTELIYFHSAPYAPHSERRVHPLDPMLAIDWPIRAVSLSSRDASAPFLDQNFDGVTV